MRPSNSEGNDLHRKRIGEQPRLVLPMNDGSSHDVSNLCVETNDHVNNGSLQHIPRLYPSEESLDGNLSRNFDNVSVDKWLKEGLSCSLKTPPRKSKKDERVQSGYAKTTIETSSPAKYQKPPPMTENDSSSYSSFGLNESNSSISCEDDAVIQRYQQQIIRTPLRVTPGIDIEVAPGQYRRLRGADETMQAIHSGRSREVSCFACQAFLRCIYDCEMVICPDCRCVSPVIPDVDSLDACQRRGAYGVGLGLRL